MDTFKQFPIPQGQQPVSSHFPPRSAHSIIKGDEAYRKLPRSFPEMTGGFPWERLGATGMGWFSWLKGTPLPVDPPHHG